MPNCEINHIDLYYETAGCGEPLLFLHGLGSSCQDWERQASVFARKYKVYLLDLRGHGKSAKPKNEYSLKIFQQDICSFISKIIQEPVHLIGISLGAMAACSAASSSPSLVKTLTLVNCPARMDLAPLKNKLHYGLRLIIVHLLGMKAMGRFLAPRLFPNKGQEKIRKKFIEKWGKNDKNAYVKSMRAMIGWNIFEKAGQIPCPVYVISAEHDYFPLEEKMRYVQAFKNAKMITVKNAHHALPFEAPDEFNKALLDVLNKP